MFDTSVFNRIAEHLRVIGAELKRSNDLKEGKRSSKAPVFVATTVNKPCKDMCTAKVLNAPWCLKCGATLDNGASIE